MVAETTSPEPAATPQRNVEESQAVVLLRGLPTLDTVHSVAIVEMDPEAENFGAILQEFEIPGMSEPLHHLYYSPTGRLYATGLDLEIVAWDCLRFSFGTNFPWYTSSETMLSVVLS